ncbi:hypothetical protein SAMN02927937_02346 [Paenimyroides aquimaris]|uniref:Carboxypeptidase-like regulatory domain-containing protein n=1 Tax=Paenimyroides marinum TaxID=1159016 RepID=A0A1H6M1X5_9FLAO|nr:hypothetical protein [Paenimyroides aquimaris]SEH95149.1 hypothetical protein SAMN02927937_02346 [Paenimyroides aquimaris]
MKNSLKLAIPKPCEKQEWSSEFISNKEEFCLLCSEKVYDATTLSDTELHKLVNQKDRPKCMKFKKSQLNRLLTVSSNHFNYIQLSNAFYGLLVVGLMTSCSVQKQSEKSIADYEQLFQTDSFFNDTLKYAIRGIIIDSETNKSVTVKCFVNLQYNGYGVWSDDNGRFKLNIPEYFVKDTLNISIVGGNYKNDYYKEFTVLKSEVPTNKVIIVEQMEEIVIGSYITFD